MFKKKFLIMVYIIGSVLSPYLANPVYAQTTIFGPEFYTRATGKPQKIVKSFSVQNLNQEFTLSVQNGEGKGGRVSSAVIELNGVRIVGPDEFNKQVATITKPITLKQQNEIAIEVRSEPGTSIVVTIFGSLPSITGVIPPGGGTVTLEGYATVIFPAGAFATSQGVTIYATSSPGTQEDYDISGVIFEAGPRLPYEIRINSGYVTPSTSFDVVLNVPDSFIGTFPTNAKIRVFVQIYQEGGEEVLDHFEIFSSTFDPVAKTISVTLPDFAFTNLRHIEDIYEAIIIVGTTFK